MAALCQNIFNFFFNDFNITNSQQAKTTMTSPIPSRTNKTLNIELVAFSYSTLLRYARERVLKRNQT